MSCTSRWSPAHRISARWTNRRCLIYARSRCGAIRTAAISCSASETRWQAETFTRLSSTRTGCAWCCEALDNGRDASVVARLSCNTRPIFTTAQRGLPMPQQVHGVTDHTKGAPVELVDVAVPDPGPNDVVVRIQACGVCHTDLTYRDGGINDEFPFLLGHEAAGVVGTAGRAVTHVEVADFVVLIWRAVCGRCRACGRGRPWYCFDTFNASQPMTLADGTALTPALGIGAFADKTLVHQGQCTKVDPAADAAVAGLLGCGVMAGLGAAVNTGAVTRDDTVAVIGCGGVGDAAIAGARLVGAKRIIAVDTDNRKLAWARDFGATHTINARELDVVEAIQD